MWDIYSVYFEASGFQMLPAIDQDAKTTVWATVVVFAPHKGKGLFV